jgi:antitoxin component YwqK of YwqJK toxin-antitoxin module
MKFVFLSFFLVSRIWNLNAQQSTDLVRTTSNKVTISINDTLVQFFAIQPAKNLKKAQGYMYYWYRDDTILTTMGDYSGRLLNGPYKAFYPEKNLLESGQFKNGEKSGQWKSWYNSGIIRGISNWQHSRRNGAFEIYDSSGTKIESGNYKNDQLDGEVTEFLPTGKTKKEVFHSGILEPTLKTKKITSDSTNQHDQN